MPEIEIIPAENRILVEPIEVKNETKSGLVICAGGESTIKTTFATVLAVATSLKEEYKVGDIIFYNEKAGVRFRLGGKNLITLTKGEILLKVVTDDLAGAINAQDLA